MFKRTAYWLATYCLALLSSECQASGAMVPWTESFVPYNGGPGPFNDANYPYLLNDPTRQHLFIWTSRESSSPLPVYIYAHGNGGKASQGAFSSVVQSGYAVISWESVTWIQDAYDTAQCIDDMVLVTAWVRTNAAAYNLDANNIIIGGRSRGSICSWSTAQGNDPASSAAIKGIYMYNALPSATFIDALVALVSRDGPPCYFAYGPECAKPIEQDCQPSPNPADIHNPKYGQKVVDAYAALGKGSQITLTDGLENAGERDVFAYFPTFVQGLEEGACEDFAKNACKADNSCHYTKPTKANKFREQCTTIPATCDDVANLPVGVKLGDVCKKMTAKSCVYQAPIRKRNRLIRPAACLDMPDFPTLCADAKNYAAMVPSATLSEVCPSVAEGCLFSSKKVKKKRVVSCEIAPTPPSLCSDAQAWAKTNKQNLEVVCGMVANEACEFYPAVRKKRRNRMRIVTPARCDVPATLSPTELATNTPTNSPTEPPTSPTSAPTGLPCNPTTRCDGKYVCNKLNNAGKNICSTSQGGCGNKGVKFSNSFC